MVAARLIFSSVSMTIGLQVWIFFPNRNFPNQPQYSDHPVGGRFHENERRAAQNSKIMSTWEKVGVQEMGCYLDSEKSKSNALTGVISEASWTALNQQTAV